MADKASREQQELAEKMMFRAVDEQDYSGFELSLKKGANVHARDAQGRTPFMITVQRNMTGWTSALLKRNPNLFDKDKNGKTVFDFADGLGSGKKEMLGLLMRALPDAEPDTGGDSPKKEFNDNAAALPHDIPVTTPILMKPPKKDGKLEL